MINHGRAPGPGVQQIPLEEFKPVPCAECGAVRRHPVRWVEHLKHRFNPRLVATVEHEAYICLGCGVQLTNEGLAVPAGDKGFLTKRDKARMGVPIED